VYCLRLAKPNSKYAFIEGWREWYAKEPPSWAWAAFYSDKVFYVGATSDMWYRIRDHIADPEKGAKICSVFPVWKLNTVWKFEDKDAAFSFEEEAASIIEGEHDAFVFQA
jgi:hypothetical protein